MSKEILYEICVVCEDGSWESEFFKPSRIEWALNKEKNDFIDTDTKFIFLDRESNLDYLDAIFWSRIDPYE